jgi:hypothetical protein
MKMKQILHQSKTKNVSFILDEDFALKQLDANIKHNFVWHKTLFVNIFDERYAHMVLYKQHRMLMDYDILNIYHYILQFVHLLLLVID